VGEGGRGRANRLLGLLGLLGPLGLVEGAPMLNGGAWVRRRACRVAELGVAQGEFAATARPAAQEGPGA
jgi:hypothetical protein